MSTGRLQALLRQEQILTARYGGAPFCHVAQVDPDNVLAERRFRWQPGLRDRRTATVGRSRPGRQSTVGRPLRGRHAGRER
jgi:hypothetical protein